MLPDWGYGGSHLSVERATFGRDRVVLAGVNSCLRVASCNRVFWIPLRHAHFRIGFFPERSSGKKCEELCRSAVLWDFNTVRLYGFGDDGRVESGSFRLIER